LSDLKWKKLTGLARASVAVGLSEEFEFKSERMNFLAKGVRLVRKVVKKSIRY
jgi:hypothetical protein